MRRKTEEDVERAKAAVRRHFDDGLADDLDPEAARQFRLMMLSRDARKFVVDHERKQVSLQYDDDQTETLASQAKAGDEEANVILTAYAIEMLERGELPPPNLRQYLVHILQSGGPPKKRRGQKAYKNAHRDERIGYAVSIVNRMGFDLGRKNAHERDVEAPPSAYSIVRDVLDNDYRLSLSLKAIESIYLKYKDNPELARS